MRIHRFFVGDGLKLKQDFWLRDEALLWQWNRVLRFRDGQKVILFDGQQTDRMYEITQITKAEAHLKMVTELERKLPKKHVYLFWSLLKKDNNDLILQKATELGVSTFIPLITDRVIKKDFNIERARKIVIEASEQSGRSNIPSVREPIHIKKALEEYSDKVQILICHQGESGAEITSDKVGFVIGPEGGWSDDEIEFFAKNNFQNISLGEFTLRAETAAIIAPTKLF